MKKIILIFIFSFYILSCYSSENDQTEIWNVNLSEIKKNVQIQDHSFLDIFDFKLLEQQGRIQEINKLNSGAAYYFSFIFEERGQRENQLIFLKSEMLSGEKRKESARELFSILSKEKKWRQLSGLLQLFIDENGKDSDILPLLKESLYRGDEPEKVIVCSGSDFNSHYSLLSLIKTENPQWSATLASYLYNGADPFEIDEIYSLLMEKNFFYSLSETDRLYILGMSSYSRGENGESGEFFSKLKLNASILDQYPVVIYNLRKALQASGQAYTWARTFSAVSKSLGEKASFVSSFVSARLYLYNKDYVNGDIMLHQAIDLATTDFEEDRAWWYLMNLYGNNLPHLTGLIEESAPLWSDPDYFNDILEEYLSLVVSRGQWSLFLRVYPLIAAYGDDETKAAFSWVKYVAGKSGYIPEGESDQLVSIMIESRSLGFYNLMGNILMGNNPLPENQDESDIESVYSDLDELIAGFLEFHLEEEAFKHAKNREVLLNDDVLRKLSLAASASGNHLRSIQFINYVSSREGYEYTLNDLKLMYPNEYESHIDLYSNTYNFSGEMLSGIIRTESAFTSDIVSFAGAVGLSQLMPETAEEQARKLKIDPLDLTDPETNIHIGSSYIKWISDRPWTENMSEVLIAYNAGGGNLRKWKRIYPAYRDELFVELIPYKETRNYVRKVLTSSVIYGALYKDLNPADIVRKIYPDFNELKTNNN